MNITYQTFVVRTPRYTILVDTCTGEDKGHPPIEVTRGQLLQTQDGYSSIVAHIEEMFQNLQTVNAVLSDLDAFVRDRSGALTSAMRDIEILKRIGWACPT
jgi:hypothetical protein